MKTLIVVDAQNDFMPGGALPVPGGDSIVPVINSFIHTFDLVVATQDWHPPDHLSFASNHPGKQPFDQTQLGDLEQVLWPDHCIQGSNGAQFHDQLDLNAVEAIFRKGMDRNIDSYSGFYDNGHLRHTGLGGYLREKRADEIFICGLAGDFCVAYTARDALQEGFSVTLIDPAIRALDANGYTRIQEELTSSGAKIVDIPA